MIKGMEFIKVCGEQEQSELIVMLRRVGVHIQDYIYLKYHIIIKRRRIKKF